MNRGNFLRISLFFTAFFCQISHAQEPEYLWPTDASKWMTSSFCEPRSDRFHAAIDIKTWNKTGYKVFAIRDGYISRVRVSPFGYGKALYQKLDTGEIVVYAHLEKFKPEIEQYIEKQQTAAGRYRVDNYLKQSVFPVKKGEVIAYTGETGIGVPHLHFEIRDAQNRPINPLSKGYKIDDKEAPVISRFGAVPLSAGSRIDDDFKYKFLKIARAGRNAWRLTKPFSFEGEVGLIIDAYDGSGTVPNKFHVYEMLLSIDGRPHLRMKYDRFSYGVNRHAVLEREYMVKRRRGVRFHRLFKDEENDLEFYKIFNAANGRLLFFPQAREQSGPIAPGVISNDGRNSISATAPDGVLAAGRHTFKISLKDFFGNVSTLSGEFIAARKLSFEPKIRIDENGVVLSGLNLPQTAVEGASLKILRKSPNTRNTWRQLNQISPQTLDSVLSQSQPLIISGLENGSGSQPRDLQLILQTRDGVASWPGYFHPARDLTPSTPAFKLSLHTDFFENFVHILLTATLPVKKAPFVEVNTGDGSTIYPDLIRKNETNFLLPLELAKIRGKNVRIVAQGESVAGQIAVAEVVFDNIHIKRGETRRIVSEDGLFSVSFSAGSLFKDIFARVKRLKTREEMFDEKLYSHIYRAKPGDFPMKSGVTIRMKFPQDSVDARKLGIYFRVGKNRWIFMANKIDWQNKEVRGRALSLETFALRIDDIPPVTEIRSPRNNANVSARPRIVAYARDRESRFASEESLVLKMDGQKVIATYDPEHGTVTYIPKIALSRGAHTVEFTARDRSGNSSRQKSIFIVN